jgi:hypothetical protein
MAPIRGLAYCPRKTQPSLGSCTRNSSPNLLEHEIVETIARLSFRKQKLWTYGLAEFARRKYSEMNVGRVLSREPQMIISDRRAQLLRHAHLSESEIKEMGLKLPDPNDPDIVEEERYNNLLHELQKSRHYQEHIEKQKRQDEETREALSAVGLQLVQTGHAVTTDYLLHELSIIDRLDAMIDRCLKRLLLVRGVKSVSASLPASPKRIRGPKR